MRKFAWISLALAAGSWGFVALSGPQGIPALLEKRDEVRRLQMENQRLQLQIKEKKLRNERLKGTASELELEFRRDGNKVREGETIYMLPEGDRPKPKPPE